MSKINRTLIAVVFTAAAGAMVLAPVSLGSQAKTSPPAGSKSSSTTPKGHQDHNPRHGGIFFMALDQKHHLEGTLLAPGTFRVYLYDARTRPLSPDQVKLAAGTVQWGEKDDSPVTPLQVSKDGAVLEAIYPKAKLPVTLTLKLRLPGASPKARPEVFTFPYQQYSGSNPGQPTPGHDMHDMHNM